MKIVPAVIMWQLWKRRNAIKHEKAYSYNWMVLQCHMHIIQFMKSKYSRIRRVPGQWNDIV